jgi:hypothetical protein
MGATSRLDGGAASSYTSTNKSAALSDGVSEIFGEPAYSILVAGLAGCVSVEMLAVVVFLSTDAEWPAQSAAAADTERPKAAASTRNACTFIVCLHALLGNRVRLTANPQSANSTFDSHLVIARKQKRRPFGRRFLNR